MGERQPKTENQEVDSTNKVFYLERDFHSNPQIVIVIASSPEEAREMLKTQLESENYKPEHFGTLKELDTSTKRLQIISPPGDRQMIR
jgi:hypothetical protein